MTLFHRQSDYKSEYLRYARARNPLYAELYLTKKGCYCLAAFFYISVIPASRQALRISSGQMLDCVSPT